MARRTDRLLGLLLMAAAFLSFLAKGSTGTQLVTGAGLQGKVVFLLWTGQAAAGVDDVVSSGRGLAGYDSADALMQSSHYGGADDGSADPNGCYAASFSSCIIRGAHAASGTPAVLDEAELTSFDADGFTLTWHTSSGVQFPIYALVMDPLDAVVCRVQPGAASSEVVTGLGFTPEAFVALPNNAQATHTFAPSAVAYGFGFSDDGTNHRAAYVVIRQDGAGDASLYGQHTTLLASFRNIIGALFPGSQQATLAVTAVSSDGFTVANTGGQTPMSDVVAFRGVTVAVGTVSSPAAPGTASVAIGFEPEAIIATAVPTAVGQGSNAYMSVGFWANGLQGCSSLAYDGDVLTARAMGTGTVARLLTPVATGADSTDLLSASIENPSETGFDVNWTAIATANRPLQYIAFAFDPPAACSGGVLPTVADPTEGDTFSGIGPHEDRVFVETDLDDDEVARWALQTPMRDSPALAAHPGWKPGVITSIGSIIRRTTGRLGAWQASSVRWAKDDHDREARDLFDRLHWYGREFRVYLAKRTSVATARLLGRFFTSRYKPTAPFKADVEGLDVIGSEFSLLSTKRDIMAGFAFDASRFPGAPAELLALNPPQPVPVYMGRWTDEGSSLDPPVLAGTTARGSWPPTDPGSAFRVGFAEQPAGSPSAPDSVSGSVDTGGNINLGLTPYNRVFAQVWAVTGGVEGDPLPFYPELLPIEITADGQKVVVDWTFAGSDPDSWRVALATDYYGARWGQVLEVAGSARTAEFTDHTWLGNGAKTAGATAPYFNRHEFCVAARDGDGLTPVSSPGGMHPYGGPYARRPYLSWLPVAGATSYTVFLGEVPTSYFGWHGSVEVPADQIDADGYVYYVHEWGTAGDQLTNNELPTPTGLLPVWESGLEEIGGSEYVRFVVARWPFHSWLAIRAGGVLISDHADVLQPDGTWPFAERYRLIDDWACSVFYVLSSSSLVEAHRSGEAEILVSACTTEDAGDGLGSTITHSPRAVRFLWERLIIQDAKGVSWGASPLFNDGTPMVRGSDYDTAEATQIARVGGDGYPARIALVSPTTVGEFSQHVVQTFGLHHGIGAHGQIRCGHYDDAVDVTASYPHLTHVRAIKGRVDITPLVDDYENAIPYQWDFRPATKTYAVRKTGPDDVVKDDASIARNFGQRRLGPLRSMPYTGSAVAVADVLQRNLLLGRFVNEWVAVPTDVTHVHRDLFSVIQVTDPEGTGALGYREVFVLVLEHEVLPGDPRQRRPTRVILKGLNITKLIDAAWVWGPDSLTTWDAMTAEEQGTYGGWAADDDTIPSDNASAKEWR